jgi:hypothetical protein
MDLVEGITEENQKFLEIYGNKGCKLYHYTPRDFLRYWRFGKILYGERLQQKIGEIQQQLIV